MASLEGGKSDQRDKDVQIWRGSAHFFTPTDEPKLGMTNIGTTVLVVALTN